MDVLLHGHFLLDFPVFFFPASFRPVALSPSSFLELDRSAFSMHLSLRKIPMIDYGFVAWVALASASASAFLGPGWPVRLFIIGFFFLSPVGVIVPA
jgi:hypothetical protein